MLAGIVMSSANFDKLQLVQNTLAGVVMSSANFDKLQLIQNTLVGLVKSSKKRDPISPILKQLHLLLICQCIDYKVSLLKYKIWQSRELEHLKELLTDFVPTWNLCSAKERKDLVMPRTKLAVASAPHLELT